MSFFSRNKKLNKSEILRIGGLVFLFLVILFGSVFSLNFPYGRMKHEPVLLYLRDLHGLLIIIPLIPFIISILILIQDQLFSQNRVVLLKVLLVLEALISLFFAYTTFAAMIFDLFNQEKLTIGFFIILALQVLVTVIAFILGWKGACSRIKLNHFKL